MYRKGEKINFEITQNEALFINDRITLKISRTSNLGEGISVNLEFIKKISKVLCRSDKSSSLCSININWDELLIERAKISGKLILSEFSKNAIQAIQKK